MLTFKCALIMLLSGNNLAYPVLNSGHSGHSVLSTTILAFEVGVSFCLVFGID